MKKFAATGLLAICLSLAPLHPVLAQTGVGNYPDKPIKIIVPFAAGIAPDVMGRIVGDGISRRLKTPVVIENRPGAGGNVGTEVAAHSPPDGYTLLVCGLSCSSAETFYRNLRFDVKKDLAPVINMGIIPSVMVVSQRSQFNSLGDVIQYAKANPNTVSFASPGFGTSPHLAGELLKRAGKIEITHIPYSSNDPLLDVAGERVTFMFIPGTAALAQKDRLRAIGVASRKREPVMANVPTIDETFPGFLMEPWNGIWAPKGTPVAIVDLLNKTLQDVLADPEVQQKMQAIGLTVVGGTREQMADYFDRDAQLWRDVGRTNNIRPQD